MSDTLLFGVFIGALLSSVVLHRLYQSSAAEHEKRWRAEADRLRSLLARHAVHDAASAATARVDAAEISRQGASDTSPLAAGARAENGEGGSGNRQPLHPSPASAVTDDRPAPTARSSSDG